MSYCVGGVFRTHSNTRKYSFEQTLFQLAVIGTSTNGEQTSYRTKRLQAAKVVRTTRYWKRLDKGMNENPQGLQYK